MDTTGASVGFGTADYIPRFSYILDWPQDVTARHHNRFAKQAMRETMEKYHEKFVPMKFGRSARRRYGYSPRNPKYVRYKQKKYGTGGLDMVKRGRTRQWMTSAFKLRVGGNAVDQSLNATLVLTFPFKGGSGRFRKPQHAGAITIAKMIIEMQRFAEDEAREISIWFRDAYMRQVEEFRRTRKRVRVRG